MGERIRFSILFCGLFVLFACGGGDGSSNESIEPVSPVVSLPADPVFAIESTIPFDGEEKVANISMVEVNLTQAISEDMLNTMEFRVYREALLLSKDTQYNPRTVLIPSQVSLHDGGKKIRVSLPSKYGYDNLAIDTYYQYTLFVDDQSVVTFKSDHNRVIRKIEKNEVGEIVNYETYQYQFNQVSASQVYWGPGTDGIWFTEDDELETSVEYTVDDQGKIIKEIHTIDRGSRVRVEELVYNYNLIGELTSIEQFGGTYAKDAVEADFELTFENVTDYTSDDAGVSKIIEYAHPRDDGLWRTEDDLIVWLREFKVDLDGRLDYLIDIIGNPAAAILDASIQTYFYDEDNLLVESQSFKMQGYEYQDDYTINTNIDIEVELDTALPRMTRKYTNDGVNTSRIDLYSVIFEYPPSEEQVLTNYFIYEYDQFDQLMSITTYKPSSAVESRHMLEYDEQGFRKKSIIPGAMAVYEHEFEVVN